jgi:nitroreductase
MLDLYDAILIRRSVRMYDRAPLPEPLLNEVRTAVEGVDALDPELPFSCRMQTVTEGDDIKAAMGGYGRLLSIPHVLVPAVGDGPNSLIDFGYRVEQLVIRLTQMGLGTCWLGALTHRASAVARFGPAEGTTIAAIVAFGRTAQNTASRAVNSAIRSVVGATRKKAVQEFAWRERVGSPAVLTELEARVLEALRASPSTGNAQPWCAVLSGGLLFLGVRTDARYYRLSGDVGYDQVDAGIGMANVSLALEALKHPTRWQLLLNDAAERNRLGMAGNIRLVASIGLKA